MHFFVVGEGWDSIVIITSISLSLWLIMKVMISGRPAILPELSAGECRL